jgi:hypothetical protein
MKKTLIRTTERLIVSITLLLYFFASPTFAAESAKTTSSEPSKDAVLAEFPFERPEEPNRVYIDLAPEGQPPFIMLLDTRGQHQCHHAPDGAKDEDQCPPTQKFALSAQDLTRARRPVLGRHPNLRYGI